MQFDARLTGDAATLARAHDDVAAAAAGDRRARSSWSSCSDGRRSSPPKQRYQRALLEHLSRCRRIAELQQAVAGVARVEAAGAGARGARPRAFQDLAQALLRTRRLLPAWRREVDGFFQQIDPVLEPELYPADAPRRLVVPDLRQRHRGPARQALGRLKGRGVRIPLTLDGAQPREALPARAVRRTRRTVDRAALFDRLRARRRFASTDAWIVESHAALHDLVRQPRGRRGALTGLSYERLLRTATS